MSITLKTLIATSLLFVVAACAQQEEAMETMVMEEETMDKM
ncbi:MAG: hypothetical protein OXQ92_03835 [Boseongicola sp.]|nr:hypothetical protein [Boseongicola sp.]MDD9976761.1 hypothetical protein [Boseongicola sp.]